MKNLENTFSCQKKEKKQKNVVIIEKVYSLQVNLASTFGFSTSHTRKFISLMVRIGLQTVHCSYTLHGPS